MLLDVFLKAGEQAGFPLTEDFNGKQQEGFSRYEHTMKDTKLGPRRWSSARAYLHPALKRKIFLLKQMYKLTRLYLKEKSCWCAVSQEWSNYNL
ncbi:MAG: hypothetical protein CM15mP86_03640 [Gammaproteobacteria bacterium]|nr:MAG: hypothetical protein CM15mP86_03640 [Gammaproteobacteria bacterium]